MWENIVQSEGIESPMLSYVRDRKRNKVGVLLSGKIDDEVCIGWSKAKVDVEDFNLYDGIEIALGRMYANPRMEKYIFPEKFDLDEDPQEFLEDKIPVSIKKDLFKFVHRMKLYYKDGKFSEVVNYIDFMKEC